MADRSERLRLADRFALQQSWWLASEIARRHGGLLISRVEDDDFNGLLIVHDGPVGRRIQIDLPAGAQWSTAEDEIEKLRWTEVVAAGSAHDAVKRLEEGAGFGVPAQAAATNRRTIVYRVAAALIAAKVDDRRSWQIVPAPLVTSEERRADTLAVLEAFASTAEQLEYAFRDIAELYEQATRAGSVPYWHEPFWLVLADIETIMVLDEAGYAHLRDGVVIDLLALYRALGRDVAAVVGVLLAGPDVALAVTEEFAEQPD